MVARRADAKVILSIAVSVLVASFFSVQAFASPEDDASETVFESALEGAEGANEPLQTSNADEALAGNGFESHDSTTQSLEKSKTIDGVTFVYEYRENEPGDVRTPGIWITRVSYAPRVVVPKQIDGKNVVSFQAEGDLVNVGKKFVLDVSNCASLERLSCSGAIDSIDVSKNPALKMLYCHDSDISSLDLSKNAQLATLSCFDNESLVHLDVSKNTLLNYLACSNNDLSSLDVSKNIRLEALNCEGNELVSLDVSKNPELRVLICKNNNLVSLDVSNNPNLMELYCDGNELTSLNTKSNPELYFLTCSMNNIASLDVGSNPALASLKCDNNNLTALTVDKNSELRDICCFNNYIADTKKLTDRFGSANEVVLPQLQAKASRLAGDTALDTMAEITKQGFSSCDTVIVSTLDGYWDALTASALAGVANCPILLTDGSSLSSQTSSEIRRLGVTKIYITGGTAAVSKSVESSLKSIAGVKNVKRLAGDIAVNTALEIYQEGAGAWSSTAIVATSETFQDALSVSPYAYAKKAPIFLANASSHTLDPQVLTAVKAGGFKRIVIVGGTAALSSDIENEQLKGFSCVRLAGATAYETSSEIATWCLTEGMSAANVGIATGESYWDALSGASLCGRYNSALVLVSDANRSTLDSFVKQNRSSVAHAYVFGGSAAVSTTTFDALRTVLK